MMDTDATDNQRAAAYALVAFSVVGGALAKKGAGSPKKSSFWFNPKAFQGFEYRAKVTDMMKMSRDLVNFASTLKWWDNKNITVAYGLLRHKLTGSFRIISMSNKQNGRIPDIYKSTVPKETEVVFTDNSLPPNANTTHAEPRIDAWAGQNGYEVVGKGASKGICNECAPSMVENGEAFFGPTLSPGYQEMGVSTAELNATFGFNLGNTVGAGMAGANDPNQP
jgi:hypothetical protein